MSETQLNRTPLYAEHLTLHARMVPFAGWEMPVQYKSILNEHRAVRSNVGLFDVSHMGEFEISGPSALDFLQRMTINDVAALPSGKSHYSALLRPHGGIIDDVMLYHVDGYYLLVVNASNVQKVAEWLNSHSMPGAVVRNVSDSTALLALQGPNAIAHLQTLTNADLSTLPRNGIRRESISGVDCLVARTGYTGEDGAEIYCDSHRAVDLWRALLGDGSVVEPCGLGARDTLRLESGKLLYGNDIDENTNPLEAGIGFAVKFDKGDFIGREALLAIRSRGLTRKLVGFEMIDRGIPRQHCPIQHEGQTVGEVTSGSYAATVDRNVGLGYVSVRLAVVGQTLDVIIRDRPTRATVVKLPFYRAKKSSEQ